MSESGKVRFERLNLKYKIQALTPLSGKTGQVFTNYKCAVCCFVISKDLSPKGIIKELRYWSKKND
jgi:hypothetical protein